MHSMSNKISMNQLNNTHTQKIEHLFGTQRKKKKHKKIT